MNIHPREAAIGKAALEGRVTFDVDTCGIGDTALHCWHAEGYKALGVDCRFYATRQPHKDIVTMFGQKFADSPKDAIVTGSDATHYNYEIRVDRGQTPRATLWSRCLPLQPKPIRPTYVKAKWHGQVPYSDVLLFPLAEFHGRTWPLAYWVDLAWMLHAKGHTVCVCVPPSAKAIVPAVPRLWTPGNWSEIGFCMFLAKLVIANDSGPSHVAGTIGTPTLAIMGPTSRVFSHCPNVVEWTGAEPSCAGCHFDASAGYRAACDAGCQVLMRLTPDIVRDQAQRMLSL